METSQRDDSNASTFDKILNRTRENIEKINKKYVGNKLVSHSDALSEFFPSSRKENSVPSIQTTQRVTSNSSNSSTTNMNTYANPLAASNVALTSILDRLAVLESLQNSSKDDTANNRIQTLETTIDNMRRQMESMTFEIKDNHKVINQLQLHISKQSSIMDAIQQDVDGRRSILSKMDLWARQGETWREEVDVQLSSIIKQVKILDRKLQEQQEEFFSRATRNELDVFRDRTKSFIQQAIVASIGNMQDKNGNGIGISSLDGVQSDALIKAAVATATQDITSTLEDKLIAHVDLTMKANLLDSEKGMKAEMKEFIQRLASDIGLSAKDGDTTSIAERMLAKRQSVDKEINLINNKLDDLSSALLAVQDAGKSSSKSLRIDLKAAERLVEDAVVISNSNMKAMQDRCSNLENLVRTSELSCIDTCGRSRDDCLDRLREACSQWLGDRAVLDRRVAVVEKASEEMTERMKLSTSAIEIFMSSSPLIKRFESTVVRTNSMLSDVSSIKSDLTATSAALARLEAAAAKMDDVVELRSRLNSFEPTVAQLCVASSTVQSSAQACHEDIVILKSLMSELDEKACQISDQSLQTHIDHQALSVKNGSIERALAAVKASLEDDVDAIKKRVSAIAHADSMVNAEMVLVKDKLAVQRDLIDRLEVHVQNKIVASSYSTNNNYLTSSSSSSTSTSSSSSTSSSVASRVAQIESFTTTSATAPYSSNSNSSSSDSTKSVVRTELDADSHQASATSSLTIDTIVPAQAATPRRGSASSSTSDTSSSDDEFTANISAQATPSPSKSRIHIPTLILPPKVDVTAEEEEAIISASNAKYRERSAVSSPVSMTSPTRRSASVEDESDTLTAAVEVLEVSVTSPGIDVEYDVVVSSPVEEIEADRAIPVAAHSIAAVPHSDDEAAAEGDTSSATIGEDTVISSVDVPMGAVVSSPVEEVEVSKAESASTPIATAATEDVSPPLAPPKPPKTPEVSVAATTVESTSKPLTAKERLKLRQEAMMALKVASTPKKADPVRAQPASDDVMPFDDDDL